MPPIKYPMGTKERLDLTVEAVQSLGRRAIGIKADVRSAADMKRVVDTTIDEFGKVDILINNAGIMPMTMAHEMSEAEWHAVCDTMVKGVWLGCKYVIPQMMEQMSGVILATGSVAALKGFGNMCHYVAAKHAVLGLMRALAVDLAPYNIRVNCVCPGHVDNEMTVGGAEYIDMEVDAFREWLIGTNLFPRLNKERDVSQMMLWLCSDRARNATGACFTVDNGFMQVHQD
jgi:NAD(P)-dependent dehydrogenase (short-subunit alcohol dehydrogenase family)